MTQVTAVKNSIMVLGHSGSGEPGHDLACCAVSTLTQTLAAASDEVLGGEIDYTLRPGYAYFRWDGQLSETAQALVAAFLIGISGVEATYPDYVCQAVETQ